MTEPYAPPETPSIREGQNAKIEKLLDQGSDLFNQLSDLLQTKSLGQRSTNNWLTMRRVFFATVALGSLLAYLIFYANMFGMQSDPMTNAVAVVSIKGEIAPDTEASADNVVPIIERACNASHVSSILLVINSGGGAPSESERMIAAIEQCKMQTDKHPPRKVIALIDSLGASAAYMIAMHANAIYAGHYSLVGSIGAIMRVNDISDLAGKFGVKEHDYRTSPLKGGPSLITGPTEEDGAEFQRLVTAMGKQFLADVVRQRGAKLKLSQDELFSGKVWTAEEAKTNGLIDGLATREELEQTIYKNMKLHDYRTKPSVAEWMGMSALVHDAVKSAVTDLKQPTLN